MNADEVAEYVADTAADWVKGYTVPADGSPQERVSVHEYEGASMLLCVEDVWRDPDTRRYFRVNITATEEGAPA